MQLGSAGTRDAKTPQALMPTGLLTNRQGLTALAAIPRRDQIEKDEPQPQVVVALGLLITN